MAYLLAVTALPAEFTGIFTADPYRVVKNWHVCICVVSGLWGGLIIGIVTEYYTSNRYTPVQVRRLLKYSNSATVVRLIFQNISGYENAML